jgi:DNA modification methylase
LKLEEKFREKAKKNMSKGGEITHGHRHNKNNNDLQGLQNSANPVNDLNTNIEEDNNKDKPIENVDTRKELAKTAKTSHDTIYRVKKINEKADDETKKKLRDGDLTINQVYKKIKDEEKGKTLEHRKKQILEQTQKELEINKPEIKLMDCVEYLNEFEDNSIDLLITDPPYSTDIEDIDKFVNGWLPIALQKVKQTGRVYICIGAYPKELHTYLNHLLNQDKFIVDNPLIWTYRNTLGQTPKMKYNLNYQVILHLYSKDSPELDTSITNEMFSVQNINAPDGRLGNRFHTWQKPDELANRLIRHASKENDLVVDCFACTGTFLISAAKHNRQGKGCEIDKDNAEIAKERGCIILGM